MFYNAVYFVCVSEDIVEKIKLLVPDKCSELDLVSGTWGVKSKSLTKKKISVGKYFKFSLNVYDINIFYS